MRDSDGRLAHQGGIRIIGRGPKTKTCRDISDRVKIDLPESRGMLTILRNQRAWKGFASPLLGSAFVAPDIQSSADDLLFLIGMSN